MMVSSWHLLQTCGLMELIVPCLVFSCIGLSYVAGCVPFHGMRHTGENIRKETEALMKSLDTTLDSIFARVCDNGSNMKKALEVL